MSCLSKYIMSRCRNFTFSSPLLQGPVMDGHCSSFFFQISPFCLLTYVLHHSLCSQIVSPWYCKYWTHNGTTFHLFFSFFLTFSLWKEFINIDSWIMKMIDHSSSGRQRRQNSLYLKSIICISKQFSHRFIHSFLMISTLWSRWLIYQRESILFCGWAQGRRSIKGAIQLAGDASCILADHSIFT